MEMDFNSCLEEIAMLDHLRQTSFDPAFTFDANVLRKDRYQIFRGAAKLGIAPSHLCDPVN